MFTLTNPATAAAAVSGTVTIATGSGVDWASDTGCVVADEPLATPVCAVDALAPGESREFRALMTPHQATADGAMSVTATFTEEGGATATASADTEVLVGSYPVTVAFDATEVVPGDKVAITMTATNSGAAAADSGAFHFTTGPGVTLVDAAGATVDPLAMAIAPGFASDVNGTVWLTEPLAPGTSTSVTLNVTVNDDAPATLQAYGLFMAVPGQHPDDDSNAAIASATVNRPVVEEPVQPTQTTSTPAAAGPRLAESGADDAAPALWATFGILVAGAALILVARRKTARS